MRRISSAPLLAVACGLAIAPASAGAAKPTKVTGDFVRVVPDAAKYRELNLAGTWRLRLTAKRYLYLKGEGNPLGIRSQPVTYAAKGTRISFSDRQELATSPCRKATYRVTRVEGGLRFRAVSDECAPRRLLLQSGLWATPK